MNIANPSDRIPAKEIAELIERQYDLRIHHHKGKQGCIAFSGAVSPEDDRRLLTALRLIKGDMAMYQ